MRLFPACAIAVASLALIPSSLKGDDTQDIVECTVRDMADTEHSLKALDRQKEDAKHPLQRAAIDLMKKVLTDRFAALEQKKAMAAKGYETIAKFDEATMKPLDERREKADMAMEAGCKAESCAEPGEWLAKSIEEARKDKDMAPLAETLVKKRSEAEDALGKLVDECTKDSPWGKVYKARCDAEGAVLRMEYAERFFHAKRHEAGLAKRVAKKGTTEQKENLKKLVEKSDEWFKAWDKSIDAQLKELKARFERDILKKSVEKGLGW